MRNIWWTKLTPDTEDWTSGWRSRWNGPSTAWRGRQGPVLSSLSRSLRLRLKYETGAQVNCDSCWLQLFGLRWKSMWFMIVSIKLYSNHHLYCDSNDIWPTPHLSLSNLLTNRAGQGISYSQSSTLFESLILGTEVMSWQVLEFSITKMVTK